MVKKLATHVSKVKVIRRSLLPLVWARIIERRTEIRTFWRLRANELFGTIGPEIQHSTYCCKAEGRVIKQNLAGIGI